MSISHAPKASRMTASLYTALESGVSVAMVSNDSKNIFTAHKAEFARSPLMLTTTTTHKSTPSHLLP